MSKNNVPMCTKMFDTKVCLYVLYLHGNLQWSQKVDNVFSSQKL